MEIPRKQKRLLQKSIALTLTCGVLLAGSAGMAYAANGADKADWDGPTVTIDAGKTWAVSTLFPETNSANIGASSVVLSGGSLTLQNGGRLINWKNDASGMTFKMTGGTLAITTGSGDLTSIDAKKIEITNGTVTLTGKDSNPWDDAAYLGGYYGMAVSGGTINMQKNSELFIYTSETPGVNYTMDITGGTINMLGNSSANDYGNDAAHIYASSSGKQGKSPLNIGGDAKVIVGDGSNTAYGVISADQATLDGNASIVVKEKGHLLLQPEVGNRKSAAGGSNILYGGDLKGKLTMTGGAFTVDAGGYVDLGKNFTFEQQAGTVTVNGSMIEKDWRNPYSEYVISGGKLVLGAEDKAYTAQNAAALHAGKLTITGGEITVGNNQNSVWSEATSLGGYGDVTTVSGGTITLNNSAELWGGVKGTLADVDSGELNISGGTITMNGATGQNAVIFAASTAKNESTHGHVTLNISGGAKIDVAKNGYIVSRETNMTGGTLAVAEDASLTVAGIIAKRNATVAVTADDGLSYAKTAGTYTQGGKFLLDGGAVTVGKNATLDFETGGVDLTMQKGSFTTAAGSIVKFNDLTYQGGTWTDSDKATLTVDSTSAASGISAKNLTVTGNLSLGTLDQNANSVTINGGGNLTVKNLDQSSGKLLVGGTSAGTLNVTDSLKNADYSADSTGLIVGNLGTLETKADVLLNSDRNALKDGANQKKLGILSGSTIKLTGLDEQTFTQDAVNAIKGALAGSASDFNGVLDLGKAEITVTPDADGNVSYGDVAGTTTDSLKGTTVKVDNTAAGNGVSGGFKDVVVSDDTATSVSADKTLQLAGSADGGALLQNSKKETLDLSVKDGAAVTLGDKTSNNQGAVGNVALGSSSGSATLNAVGNGSAAFTAGDITTNASVTANVNVEGATLNAGKVGASGNAVDNINLNNGAALKATGDVHVDTLVNNATLTSDKTVNVTTLSGTDGTISGTNVTVTTVADLNNGTIHATGDAGAVTLTNGATDISGSIISDKGGITATGKDIIAKDGEALTLRAENGTIAAKDITATSVAAKQLTTTNVSISEGILTLGAADSTVGGTLNLDQATASIGQKLTVTSTATIDGGTLTTAEGGEISFSAEATLKGGAVVTVDKLTGANGQKIFVGSDAEGEGGATLRVNTLNLNGGSLIVDPAWGAGPSKATVGTTAATSTPADIVLDGNVGVGQNAMLTIGTTDTSWLDGQVAQLTEGGTLSQNGIDAALGLTKHITLDSGKGLVVDGTKTNGSLTFTGNQLDFGAKSLLVVDAAAFDATKGAISSAYTGATANVEDGAKLRIANAKMGETYEVLDSATITSINLNATGWQGENLSTNSSLIKLDWDGVNKVFTTDFNRAQDVYKNLSSSLHGTIDKMVTEKANDTNSTHAGAKFLSRATAIGEYLNGDVNLATTTIESAARMAPLGGVPQMTLTALDASRNAIDARTSFASADQGRLTLLNDNSEQSGGALWLMPIYQKVKSDDLDAGHYGYDVDGHLTGAAFGYDYTNSGNSRTGLMFSFGSGNADSSGLSYTDNDLDYWGVGAYTSWKHDNFNFVADLSYAKTKNDLTQSLSSAMNMGQLKADDISGKALSFGLRGEYRYQNGDAEIIPHFGLRYTKLDTDSYTVSSTTDGNIMHAGDSSQKIWTFPIGVTFTKTIEQKSGWTCKPVFDFSLIPASGDLDADSVVHFTGVNHNALVSTEVMGDFSYKGTLGVEFGKDNLTYGLGYSIQASSDMTNHTVYGMVHYAF